MRRALLASLFVATLSMATGCTLCCAPHDYCGPVWESEGNCDFCYRHNSGIGSWGGDGYAPTYGPGEEIIEESEPETMVRNRAPLRPVPDRRYTPHLTERNNHPRSR